MAKKYSNTALALISTFAAGATVGAGFALLYAPKSGRETREGIVELSTNTLEKVREYNREAQDKIRTLVEEGRHTLSEGRTMLLSAIEAGKEAIRQECCRQRETHV